MAREIQTLPFVLQSTQERKKAKNPTYEESVLQILKDSKGEEIDEDKSFLMSLLPFFKKLLPQSKLNLKIEFLQVLQCGMVSAVTLAHGHYITD